MKRAVVVGLILVVGVTMAAPLAGQARPQAREGLWGSAGLGFGSSIVIRPSECSRKGAA